MKALFLIFHGFAAYNGISKKIFYQVSAMRRCGVDTHLCYLDYVDGGHRRMIDDTLFEDYGKGMVSKLKKRFEYKGLVDHIISHGYDFLYIRSDHNANPFLNRMVRRVHKAGVKVALEIPTYPYEGQFAHASLGDKVKLKIDMLFRNNMARHLDFIVSFTDNKTIFGVPNIEISNGIDFEATPVKSRVNDTSQVINLIGVAEIHYWHGFDRIVEGMAEYYASAHSVDVVFNVVGGGNEIDVANLKNLVVERGMQQRVIFHGTKSGDELTEMFNRCDLGIASLGRHRSGNTRIKTLKNREYAARGIPFVYSENDDDFDTRPYVLRVPSDETPVDIGRLVDFYRSVEMSPEQIRSSIESTLSWTAQMQKVIDRVR